MSYDKPRAVAAEAANVSSIATNATAITAEVARAEAAEASNVATANNTFVPGKILVGSGIDPTGATDSTAALQTKINALTFGEVGYLPEGYYKYSVLDIPDGVRVRGAGWAWKRDALGVFGAAGYATPSNINGTVLVCTKTSAGASVVGDTSLTSQIGLEDLFLLGPGAGTSTGLALGSTTHAVVDSTYRNVGIANFATGLTRDNVEDCIFDNIKIHGCSAGMTDGNNTNNNIHLNLGISACGTGQSHRDQTSLNNLYLASLFQANTGLSLQIDGRNNVWIAPYLENAAATNSITFAAGAINCHVDVPEVGGANNTTIIHTITAGAITCSLTRFRIPLAIVDNGAGSSIRGNLTNYSGTGTFTDLIDDANNRQSLPRQINSGLVMATGFLMTTGTSTTAARPTTGRLIGSMHYDTSLAKPIWWDGTQWRDAAGTVV